MRRIKPARRAALASVCVTVLAACTSGPATLSAARSRAATPRSSSASTSSEPAAPSSSSPTTSRATVQCDPSRLALAYYAGGPAAGNDGATIRIANHTGSNCLLLGPITVAGVDAAQRAVTNMLTYRVQQHLVLTAHAVMPAPGRRSAAGRVTADLRLIAHYRDEPTSPDGLCDHHRVIPDAWHLGFPDGTHRTLRNYGKDPAHPDFTGLVTCRGRLGTPDPIAATST